MRRVAIITIHNLNNYGNRLQNYAVHKILKDIGMKPISYAYNDLVKKFSVIDVLRCKFNKYSSYRFSSNPLAAKSMYRTMKFYNFTKKYIPTKGFTTLKELSKKADCFVLGSDQVWNVKWFSEIDKHLFLLTFAKNEQKICLSPSFGLDDLSDEWKPYFEKELKTFPTLSVREKSGADIIKSLTGRTAEVLIDPTLMLDKSDWLKIARKPKNIDTDTPYILTYFLGDFSQMAKQKIQEITGLGQFNVYKLNHNDFLELYCCGPSEFLYLFSRANLILTDSFHACVFAFLFSRPFLVFKREDGNGDMFSRIETLLGELDMERKMWDSKFENDIFECDYTEGEKRLKALRERELCFLKKAGLDV